MDRYSTFTLDDIDRLVKSDEATIMKEAGKDDILVHGPGGLRFKHAHLTNTN